MRDFEDSKLLADDESDHVMSFFFFFVEIWEVICFMANRNDISDFIEIISVPTFLNFHARIRTKLRQPIILLLIR